MDERGWALPFALFALVLLYMIGTAGFVQSTLELEIARSHRRSVEAFYTADGGLQHFLGTLSGQPTTPASITLPAGAANISGEPLILVAPGLWLYRVESVASLPLGRGGVSRRTTGTLILAAVPPHPLAAVGSAPIVVPGTWYEAF